MKVCTASLNSLTYAIKAQKELAGAGIDARVVKLDPSLSRRGCTYGVEFDCTDGRAVRSTLGGARIPVTGYRNGGGEIL